MKMTTKMIMLQNIEKMVMEQQRVLFDQFFNPRTGTAQLVLLFPLYCLNSLGRKSERVADSNTYSLRPIVQSHYSHCLIIPTHYAQYTLSTVLLPVHHVPPS